MAFETVLTFARGRFLRRPNEIRRRTIWIIVKVKKSSKILDFLYIISQMSEYKLSYIEVLIYKPDCGGLVQVRRTRTLDLPSIARQSSAYSAHFHPLGTLLLHSAPRHMRCLHKRIRFSFQLTTQQESSDLRRKS